MIFFFLLLNLLVISSISPVCLKGNFFGKLSEESVGAKFVFSCPTTCIWGLGPRGGHSTGVTALLHWAQSGLGNGSCGHGSQPRGPVLSSHTWLVLACSDSRDVRPTSASPTRAEQRCPLLISSQCCPIMLCLIVLCFRPSTTEMCYNPFTQTVFEHNYWFSGS